MEEVSAPIKDCAFSRECCDVRIGKNTFKGDLRNYKIHFENERVNCDVTLSGLAEKISENGIREQMYFGLDENV